MVVMKLRCPGWCQAASKIVNLMASDILTFLPTYFLTEWFIELHFAAKNRQDYTRVFFLQDTENINIQPELCDIDTLQCLGYIDFKFHFFYIYSFFNPFFCSGQGYIETFKFQCFSFFLIFPLQLDRQFYSSFKTWNIKKCVPST